MAQALGTSASSAGCVLNTRKGVKELFTFVGRTARLKSIYGEVLQLGDA